MNRTFQILAGTAVLTCVTALGTMTAIAQHPAGPTCMDIQWNAELLKSYPRAPAACQEVVERDGKKYARFKAKVTAVDPDVVKVRFLTSHGTPEREMSLKPAPDAKVELNGKKVGYAELRKGDVLMFWVPERQLGVIADPDEKAASTIVVN